MVRDLQRERKGSGEAQEIEARQTDSLAPALILASWRALAQTFCPNLLKSYLPQPCLPQPNTVNVITPRARW